MALSVANSNPLSIRESNIQVKKPSLRATRAATRAVLTDIGNGRAIPTLAGVKRSAAALRELQPESRLVEERCETGEDRVQQLPAIPTGIRDIDQQDSDNPQLCAEYAPFMYAYLRQLENKLAIRKDFLKGCVVTSKMRGVLLDWLVEVHQQFKLLQETLYLTIFMIDKFLQTEGPAIKRNKLQLVGVAAMFTASKVEEMYAPEINDFVYITDNAYSAAEIRQMELRILSSINFGLGRPLPLHFLRRNSKAGDVDVLQHTVAKYVLELAQLEYDLAHLTPSLLAASSLYLALLLLNTDNDLAQPWSPALEYYSSYSLDQLLPTTTRLATILKAAPEAKLKAVYTKYLSKKFLKVAAMEECKGARLSQLAEAASTVQ